MTKIQYSMYWYMGKKNMYLRRNGIGSLNPHADDSVYKDTALVDNYLLASDNLWYQLFVHC